MIKSWIVEMLRKVVDISIRPFSLDAEEEIRREILAAQYLSPLSSPYIPWSRAALVPSAVATLLKMSLLIGAERL